MFIFAGLGLLALQVPVVALAGSKAKFTLFDAFGPISGGFLGPVFGTLAVALMELTNFFLHGAHVLDAGTVIRFFPMLFAALYFARKSRVMLLVPLAAIVAFVAHPIGRTVWYYAVFWLIPILTYFARDRSLLARSLGATFTAHAVGGALWIYAFNLPKAVWVGLIPVVIMERIMFAVGIAVSYYALTNILATLVRRKFISVPFSLEQRLTKRLFAR